MWWSSAVYDCFIPPPHCISDIDTELKILITFCWVTLSLLMDSLHVSHVSWFWLWLFKSADGDVFVNNLISPLSNVKYWTIIERDGAWISKLFRKGSWETSKALALKKFGRRLLGVYQVGLQTAFWEVSEAIETVQAFARIYKWWFLQDEEFFFLLNMCCMGALVSVNFWALCSFFSSHEVCHCILCVQICFEKKATS